MEPHCPDHLKHDYQLENHDKRIGDLEHESTEFKQVIARIDTLVASLNKMYWIIASAFVGCVVVAIWTLIVNR